MQNRRWLSLLGAVSVVCVALAGVGTLRSASPVVNSTVAIVDPYAPVQQAGVDSGGNLKVAVSGALTANQSVNVAQVNGVTPLMGAGNTGTGSPRVTLATDQAALAGLGVGATAAAPPANAAYMGANGSGATGGQLRGLITCDLHAKYDASDTGSITLVTGVASRKIYICGFLMATGGTATNLKLREGSDANCATNGADLTPAYQLVANDRVGVHSPFWSGLAVSTNAYYVCINASAANAHQAQVWYTIL